MQRIPDTGLPWPQLRAELEAAKARDYDWRGGRMAVFVFHRDAALEAVQKEAYLAFFTENNLGQRAFPSLARLEREVIEMGLGLMAAPAGAGGTFTAGGSESIFLSMLAAREAAREAGRVAGNIVLPDSAHLTFDRAAWYLGLEARRVPVGVDRRADVAAMAAASDDATVALVGSAPCYPFGLYDPIAPLAELAAARRLWMHVDACVGGFLAPFWPDPLPPWDFSVPGVTAISADIHKHGMAPKGASLLLLRDAALKRHHRFESRAWQRGAYAAETTLGTRPGGAVAAAWAVMRHLGTDGYRDCAGRIHATKQRLLAGVQSLPGLAVVEGGDLGIVVWGAADPVVELGALAAAMDRRGWLPGRMQRPDGMHLHLNPIHAGVVDTYLTDLAAALGESRGATMDQPAPAAVY